jgi:L-fucose isomerase-like protein
MVRSRLSCNSFCKTKLGDTTFFRIYGMDVKDLGDITIPEDVKEKILQFAKTELAVSYTQAKYYLSMGSA